MRIEIFQAKGYSKFKCNALSFEHLEKQLVLSKDLWEAMTALKEK